MTVTNEEISLGEKLYHQIKYYFSDYNLSRDKFLTSKLKEDPDQYINLNILVTFNKLKQLCDNPETIATELTNYTNTHKENSPFIIVDALNCKVKRNYEKYPVPENFSAYAEKLKKTNNVYVKGFPKDITLDELHKYFANFGSILNIFMRYYTLNDKKANQKVTNAIQSAQNGNASTEYGNEDNNKNATLNQLGLMRKTKDGMRFFKGSVFVTFEHEADAEKYVKTPEIKYKDIELIKAYQHDYETQKAIEMKGHNQRGTKTTLDGQPGEGEENSSADDGIKSRVEQLIQRGNILHLSGFDPENGKLTRHSLKDTFDHFGKVAWIDFEPGQIEAFIRFTGQDNVAPMVLEKMEATRKSVDANNEGCKEGEKVFDWTLKLTDLPGAPEQIDARILAGDEEFQYWTNIVKQIIKGASNDKNFNRKKRGKQGKKGGGGGGFENARNKRKLEHLAAGKSESSAPPQIGNNEAKVLKTE